MHKIRARLKEKYIRATRKKRVSFGGRYHTGEWQEYTVNDDRLKLLESFDALDIKFVSDKSDAKQKKAIKTEVKING